MEDNDSEQLFILFRLKAKINAIHGWGVLQGILSLIQFGT